MKTNGDFYNAIEEMIRQHACNTRSLEEYLRALMILAGRQQEQNGFSLSFFYQILADAFHSIPCEFDDSWRRAYADLDPEAVGFAGCQAIMIHQVVDLREMEENGQLGDEYRYFGIDAPRGVRWYNFDPLTYLECGTAGSLGGWDPEENTGRMLVPGDVAVIGDDGHITSMPAADVPNPIFAVPEITWDVFKRFLYCGQSYE